MENDTISRQAAINALENTECELLPEEWNELTDAIMNVPPAQPETHWVSCSVRLPNTNGIYIVTRRISDGFECQNITDACYFDGSDTWHDDTRINHERKYLTDVIAWCEPPEPYRAEGRTDA